MASRTKKSEDESIADRQARLAEVRRQIAAGTYETHERLEAAADALLDELALFDELAGEPPRPAPRPK
jgi:anti-sigma28 factor (negative regulator of flagellin synthesis)